jgi:AraC-like DNA-binding protein
VYRERASRVAGAVVWQKAVPAGAAIGRVLPDGCMDLLWVDGELQVAGPDTVAYVPSGPTGVVYTGLRFPSGVGPAVLGVPGHELRDRRVPLSCVWPSAQVRRLTELVANAADPAAALEEVAVQGWVSAPDPAMRAVVSHLHAGRPVRGIAESVGLSERQLHRRCLAAFGYGPKTLGRILRMNRAVELARGGRRFAAVAAAAGYADQAHLARDVRALTGVTLGELVS